MSLRYLSVCSGIEAATVAWHPLGWSPVAFAEIEPFPCAVLAQHYGSNLPGEPLATNGVPNLGDITRFAAWPDLAIDLLVGGTPCQSFSVAGLRKGLADPRGNLALTYLGIADRYRPRWLVWENVPGVLSSRGGRDFGAFLGGLGELGYGFAYRVLDAQFVRVDGFGRAVPQRRRRVFVVGHLGDWRRAAAVLFDAASLHGDPEPRREAGQGAPVGALGGTPPGGGWRIGPDEAAAGQLVAGALSCGDRGISPDQAAAGHIVAALDQTNGLLGDVVGTIEAAQCKGNRGHGVIAFDPTQITSRENRARPEPGAPCHPLAAAAHPPMIAFDCKAGGDTGFAIGDVPGPLRGEGHGGGHSAIALDLRNALRQSEQSDPADRQGMGIGEDVSFTLSKAIEPGVAHGSAVRRLTPLECERLQAFPDGYTAIPFRGRPAADGPRYKALGNSKAVNCPRWLGRRIQAVEAIGAELREAAE